MNGQNRPLIKPKRRLVSVSLHIWNASSPLRSSSIVVTAVIYHQTLAWGL
ncbi:unnamed protein product [Dibothriocephalus latus]|uniref:Uncharacterized protein n=1 Tax=Dibothriocephalus latus TaxID=60516 RepID=A0A3P6PXB4_DIBLA|nr:unnamed protein product [Dibothriocephalus latus]